MSVYCIVNSRQKLHDPTRKIFLNEPLQYDNAQAHCFRLTLTADDGTSPADLSDVSVVANFMRPDGGTVEIATGTITGNVVEVILPAACYASVGRYKLTVNLVEGSGGSAAARTAMIVEGITERNTSGTPVDPGTIMPSINDLIQEIEDARAEIEPEYTNLVNGVVRHDMVQSLTDAQKAQARENVGAASEAGFEAVTGFVPLDGDDGTATNRGVSVTRNGQRFTFSGTSHSGHSDYCLVPNVRAANYSTSNPPTWAALSTMPLVPGKKYRLTAKVVSGGVSEGNFNIWPYNSEGEQLSTYTLSLTRGNDHLDFVFSGTYFCVTAYVNAACVPGETPLVFDLTLSDAPDGTNIADEERGNVARYTHNPGDLILYRGQLYETTQAIAPDDTITPGTNVTATTVAEQLAERDTAIAAETAARETAIAGLPMGAGAYFAGLLGANGTVNVNRKQVTVSGNHIHMEGMGSGTSSGTYAMFNTLGTAGAVSGTYSVARIKSLFTGGYCYAVEGRPLFATGTGHILRVTYVKRSDVEPQNAWDWGYGLYTYNADTDTVTNLVHNYSMSSDNGILIYDTLIASNLIDIARENGNLALVIYGKTDAQWASSKIDLYWEIIPVTPTT